MRAPSAPEFDSVPRTLEGLRTLYMELMRLDSPKVRPVSALSMANGLGVISMQAESQLHSSVASMRGASWTPNHEKEFHVWVREMRDYYLEITKLFGLDLAEHGDKNATIEGAVDAAQIYYTDHPEGRVHYWAPGNKHAQEAEARWALEYLSISLPTPPSPTRSAGSFPRRIQEVNALRLAQ